MGAFIYIFLCFFIISNTFCQVFNEIFEENAKSIKVCEVCVCSETAVSDDSEIVYNILCSELDGIKNVTDLDKIEWPQNVNGLKISAIFDGLNLMTLGKLPANTQVESIKFPNNAMEIYWPEPLQELPNLKRLSLASNRLNIFNSDLFHGIHLLEDLDLSDNGISDINPLAFQNLENLKRLNLQNNRLKAVPLEAIIPLSALEDLDLDRNKIYELRLQKAGNGLMRLKRLSLKGNQIRSVMGDSFPDENNLELLDLSENKIEMVIEQALVSSKNLKELNLEQNNITLIFQLPASLATCNLRMNSMRHWLTFPGSIKLIDLSYNKLETLHDADADFSNLEALYLIGNQIKEFDIAKPLPKLFILDISYNFLKEIPTKFSEQYFPNLYELWLDGNPMERVYFANVIVVKKLHLKEMPRLQKIDEKAFTNVMGPGAVDDKETKCFDLHLSDCRSLSEIHEDAFEGTAVCMLDISSNNLTTLPRDLLPWATVSEGVNLQHNPWRCECDMQWMLDQLLPLLYKQHAYLLDDVRCGSPRAVEQLRLVHWYNWTDRTLCSDYLGTGPRLGNSIENPFTNMSLQTLLLSIAIVVLTAVAMGLAIYLVCTRKKYNVRRAAMRRRKQTADDVHKNGHNEQLKALKT